MSKEKWLIYWTCFFHKRKRSKEEKRQDSKKASKTLGIIIVSAVVFHFLAESFIAAFFDSLLPKFLSGLVLLIILEILICVILYFFLTKGAYCSKKCKLAIKMLSNED